MNVLAEVFDPAPRSMACQTYRFEGEEEIDGRQVLGYLVHSRRLPYCVYRLSYMLDSKEMFCACPGAMFYNGRWQMEEEREKGLGPLIYRPREQMCWHMAAFKQFLLDYAETLKRLEEAA